MNKAWVVDYETREILGPARPEDFIAERQSILVDGQVKIIFSRGALSYITSDLASVRGLEEAKS